MSKERLEEIEKYNARQWMGVLFKAANIKKELSKEIQKQDMIQQLNSLGVTDCREGSH